MITFGNGPFFASNGFKYNTTIQYNTTRSTDLAVAIDIEKPQYL